MSDDQRGRREVEVPLRVYKAVTVFSTLFAVIAVVGGFLLLDVATNRARLPLDQVHPIPGILGVVSIVAGAVVYAYSTRFRTAEMGRSNNGGDEPSGDG